MSPKARFSKEPGIFHPLSISMVCLCCHRSGCHSSGGVVFQKMLGVGKDPAALKAVKQQLRALEHSVLTDESQNRSITRVILMSSGMICSFH